MREETDVYILGDQLLKLLDTPPKNARPPFLDFQCPDILFSGWFLWLGNLSGSPLASARVPVV